MSMMDRGHSTRGTSDAQGYVVGGTIAAIIAVFFLPIVVGPIGAVLGFMAYQKGDRRGLWVAIGSIVAMIVGMALGAWLWSQRS